MAKIWFGSGLIQQFGVLSGSVIGIVGVATAVAGGLVCTMVGLHKQL